MLGESFKKTPKLIELVVNQIMAIMWWESMNSMDYLESYRYGKP